MTYPLNFKILTLIIVFLSIISGCNTIPKDAFKVSESSLQMRQMQTRSFETKDEISLLSASAGVLQDMGYLIEEIEKDAGLLTGEKDADATDVGQIVTVVLVAALTGAVHSVDDTEKIRVSLITQPSRKDPNVYLARITFQKIVWNTNKQITKAVTIDDPQVYQQFFQQLSKSVFLEANNI